MTAMIGWIAVKGQVHYSMFTRTEKANMPLVYLGLLGSLTSLLFAVFGRIPLALRLRTQPPVHTAAKPVISAVAPIAA